MKKYNRVTVKFVYVMDMDVITESVEGTFNIDKEDKWFS